MLKNGSRKALPALIVLALLDACGGDDSNTTEVPKGVDETVESKDDLIDCTTKIEGEITFVEETHQTLICHGGKWQEQDADNNISSEKITKLSSSSKNDEMINNPDSLGSGISSNSVKSSCSSANISSSSNKEKRSSSSGNGGLSSSTVLSSSSQKTISSSSKQDNASSSSNSKKTSSSSTGSKFANGVLTDYRDGHTYGAVTIGSQTWMSENLNYAFDSSFCYNNDEDNCTKYGRLYKWAAAVNKSEESCGFGNTCSLPSGKIQGVCPSEWHLPSKAEFETLISAVGGKNSAGKVLKAAIINGSDDFAFAALPAGYKAESEGFLNEGRSAYFWSSEEGSYGVSAYEMSLNSASAVAYLQTLGKSYAASIRCIKDVPWNPYVISSSSSQNISSSSSQNNSSSSSQSISSSSTGSTLVDDILTDYRDGKTYRTVKIGNQRWMAENLNYKVRFSVCYNKEESYCETYGRLYDWETATCANSACADFSGRGRGVCPERWHLPSKKELETLIETIGGEEHVCSALASTSGWNENINSSDAFLFSALPAGICYISDFYDSGMDCRSEGIWTGFWSSTTSDGEEYYLEMHAPYCSFPLSKVSSTTYGYALSVRCVYDFNE